MVGKKPLKFLPAVAILCVLGLEVFPRLAQTQNAPQPNVSKVDYLRDIQPILEKSCFSCHGATAQMSGLRLDSRAAFLAGGTNGKIVVPGQAEDSTLYKRVAGVGDLSRMPFGGQALAPAQIAMIRAWIDQGAEIPESATTATAAPEPAKKHWGFIAPVRPAVPVVDHSPWVRNPIDAFILARLEKEGLKPSPPVDRVTDR